jgi:lactoylglutathione lyase
MTFRDSFPILYVADVERSVRFYRDLLGFDVQFTWPDDGTPEFAFLSLEPSGIGLSRATAPPLYRRDGARNDTTFELCVYTDDTDAAAERLRRAGATELKEPEDMPWGERLCYFTDPDGNPLHITAKLDA